MRRVKVTSSMIKSIGYDPGQNLLEIEFKDNSIYQYYSVSQIIHKELMKASSHGKYFHKHIKDKYKYKKIK